MKSLISSLIGLVLSVSVGAEPLLEGRVRLASGEPVADAQVRIFDMTDLQRGAIARATTDGTGYFALPLATLTGRALPERFALGPNYPNPFNPSTIIPYQLAASAPMRLEVFNLLGQRIATLVDGERPAGFHTATWHATDASGRAVGAGVYIYRMTVGVESQTGRMVLIDGQAGISAEGTASVMPGASGVSGSNGEGEQVYGLIVSGSGLVPYVDETFRVEAGMAPVELVVSAGQHSAGKATDDDCAFCDLFDSLNDAQEEEGTRPSGKAQATLEAPPAPTNLRFEAVTDSSCRVRWDAAEGATDYDVNYKRAVGGKWTNEPHKGVRLYNTIYDLEPGTEYRWAARAENRDGSSEWVFGPNFTTLPDNQDGQDSDVETIPDVNLRAAIATALGKSSDAPITEVEMETLTNLQAEDAGISDLTGLESATNLHRLHLDGNKLTDISALAGLTNLRRLNLNDNKLTDISALAGLTNLIALYLDGNKLTDISALAGLTNLRRLGLGNNNISDISALAGLTNLIALYLRGNKLTDISALAGLTNLIDLYLDGNKLTDISALAGLTNLRRLGLGNNNISDISALAGLTNLQWLYLNGNNISDISALAGLTNKLLGWLDLNGNKLTDISALAGLTHLRRLHLNGNNITDISSLRGLTNLTGLELNFNNITDVSSLRGLTNLTGLELNFNNITDVSSLRGLTNLTGLELRGNPLRSSSINDHIPALERSGVTVFFDSFREGPFDIELVFLSSSFTEDQKRMVQYAARRWMSITRKDLPDYTFTQGWSGECGDHSYAIPSGERIDDLRIYITSYDASYDDDTSAGWASPRVLRATSHLSVVGCMGFNLNFINDNSFVETALHEIGHVLGVGSLWDDLGFLQNPSENNPNADTHFNGPLAIAAFNDAGGWDYPGAKVPVYRGESRGADSHWRNSVLAGELMMSKGGSGRALSAITVQSLADLGYSVDVTQADPYTLPSAAAKASAKIAAPSTHAQPEFSCGVGEQREPIYVVDEQGNIIRTLHR